MAWRGMAVNGGTRHCQVVSDCLAEPCLALQVLKSTTAPGGAAVRLIYCDRPYGVGLSGLGLACLVRDCPGCPGLC